MCLVVFGLLVSGLFYYVVWKRTLRMWFKS